MKVIVIVSKSFKRQANPLLKKFSTLTIGLNQLENELNSNPYRGKFLGKDSYKIRLAVKSKGKVKSGGFRVITHINTEIVVLIETEDKNIIVNLISIYDKNETASISDKELRDLIAGLENE